MTSAGGSEIPLASILEEIARHADEHPDWLEAEWTSEIAAAPTSTPSQADTSAFHRHPRAG